VQLIEPAVKFALVTSLTVTDRADVGIWMTHRLTVPLRSVTVWPSE